MRPYAVKEPNEKHKDLTHGQIITAENLKEFVETLEIPESAKAELRELTPAKYIGNAVAQAQRI